MFEIYLHTLSGDVLPLEFSPKEKGFSLRTRIAEQYYPETDPSDIALFAKTPTGKYTHCLGSVTRGGTIYVFIRDPCDETLKRDSYPFSKNTRLLYSFHYRSPTDSHVEFRFAYDPVERCYSYNSQNISFYYNKTECHRTLEKMIRHYQHLDRSLTDDQVATFIHLWHATMR